MKHAWTPLMVKEEDRYTVDHPHLRVSFPTLRFWFSWHGDVRFKNQHAMNSTNSYGYPYSYDSYVELLYLTCVQYLYSTCEVPICVKNIDKYDPVCMCLLHKEDPLLTYQRIRRTVHRPDERTSPSLTFQKWSKEMSECMASWRTLLYCFSHR